MKQVQFTITIKLQAPILTHTSGSIGFGLDTAMLRDKNGTPQFTGSLIRGNIRHAWANLNEITEQPSIENIERWLGKQADSAQQIPNRAVLTFSKYWKAKDWDNTKQAGKRYRIAIDENTGAVKTGALQVIDSPYSVGEQPEFTGIISTSLDTEAEIQTLQKWLKRAFTLIPAIGSLKTNGFGKILNTTIEEKVTNIKATPQKPLNTELLTQTQLGLHIKPSTSFCFAKPAIGENNHFESEIHIPAAAIIAAIANKTNAQKDNYKTLIDNLSKIHITHARPVQTGSGKRPISIPLSVVESNKQLHNIADKKQPEITRGQAPTFLIDWKPEQFDNAEKRFNPPKDTNKKTTPDINLNIRTAIERITGTAKNSQLFSMETVSPNGFDWLSNINLNNVTEADRPTVIQQLHTLFQQPLNALGKTKASAKITLEKSYPYSTNEQAISNSDETVVIYLQTPARLLPTGYQVAGTNQGESLHKHYQEAWHELSNGNLKLSHFFAQQKLEGGEHWWKRFRQEKGSYHPEIFTREGSVFILDIIKEPSQVKDDIRQWQQQGLPQLKDTIGGEHWETNPWIAANGYGEIAINLKINEALNND